MSTGKVYIVNKAGHDFSNAEKFGELVPVTVGNMNVFRPDRPLFQIETVLKEFDPENDYLLLSGNVFANVLSVTSIILQRAAFAEDFQIRFLVYDAKNQKYLVHVLKRNDDSELFFQRT